MAGRLLLLVTRNLNASESMRAFARERLDAKILPFDDRQAPAAVPAADLVLRYHEVPRRVRHHWACRRVEGAARRHGVPVLNTYAAVRRVRRDRMLGIWRRAGIPCPEHAPFRGAAGLRRALVRTGTPAVLRRLYGDSGTFAYKVHDAAEARRCGIRRGVSLRFLDFRAEDGWIRRYRALVLDGQVHPINVIAARNWLVSVSQNREEVVRWVCGPGREEFEAYGASPEPHADLLREAVARIGLDGCCVDYALDAERKPILFEVNPDWGWGRAWNAPEHAHIRASNQRLEDRIAAWIEAHLGTGR